MSLECVWCFQSVLNSHLCQYQFSILQQVSLLRFLSNYKEFWSCFVFASVIIFLLKARKISWLESWFLWVIRAEGLLSIFVFNFSFWWLFVCLTKSIFMTIYFFVSSNLSFDTFLKLSFWSFLVFATKAFLAAFHCRKPFWAHFFFVEFSFFVGCQLAKSVSCLLFQSQSVSFYWENFQKDFLVATLKRTFWKVFVLLSWTWFSFGFLLVNERDLLLSWVSFLVFRRNEW